VIKVAPAAASGFSYPLIDEIGRITGVRARQVQNWAAGTSRPQAETRDRLVDVHYMIRQLEDVYLPEGIEIWLHARNSELGDNRPLDLLEGGDFEPVMNVVLRLRTGAL
jgi:hypothetical protein